MWGNKAGWGISAVMVILFAVLLFHLDKQQNPSTMSEKFAADPQNLAPLALPIAPETIVPAGLDNCDAGDKYREAIEAYKTNPTIYLRWDSKNVDQLAAVELLVEAAQCNEMTLFSKNPAELVNFNTKQPPLDALKAVGVMATTKSAYLRAKNDLPGARKYALAAFALANHLYHERITFEELDAAFGLFGAASGALASVQAAAGETGQAAQTKAFDVARTKYMTDRLEALRRMTHTRDGKSLEAHAGDIFALAQKSKERMWRVEALRMMGRMRYYVGDNGKGSDQRTAEKLLAEMAANEPDPVVKAAAIAGRDLDERTYNVEN